MTKDFSFTVAELAVVQKLFDALRPLVTPEEMSDKAVQKVAEQCIDILRRDRAFIHDAAIVERVAAKVTALHKHLCDEHELPITLVEALTALPSYCLNEPERAVVKLRALLDAAKDQYRVTFDHHQFFKTYTGLKTIVGLRIGKPLANAVAQHELLAANNIVIDRAHYVNKSVMQNVHVHTPHYVLSGVLFIRAAWQKGRASYSNRGFNNFILNNLSVIRFQTGIAAAVIHMDLQPLLLSSSPLSSFALLTLVNKKRFETSRELVQMLGGNTNKNLIDPAKDVSLSAPPALRDLVRARYELLIMLARLNFLHGFAIDPACEPPEFATFKNGRWGNDRVAQQKQAAYAVQYFGEQAADWSAFEIYQAVKASPQWQAVVEPAQRTLERRAAARLAGERQIRGQDAQLKRLVAEAANGPKRPGAAHKGRGVGKPKRQL